MDRKCKVSICDNPSIIRGKYCLLHRTGSKSKSKQFNKEEINLANNKKKDEYKENSLEKTTSEELERKNIMMQQQSDYDETLELNRELLRIKEENELLEVIKISELANMIENKKKTISQIYGDEINIKFTFPSGFTTQQSFSKLVMLSHLYTYIEIYVYDNNLIFDYELMCYPNKVLYNNDELLCSMKLPNKLKISINKKD